MDDEIYEEDEASGDSWTLLLGDSCERLAKLADESVDMSVYSPPFKQLFVYSPSIRDLNNSATEEEFYEHYSFIIREMLRVTKPGRNSCVHVADLPTTKAYHGVTGLYDFPGAVIQAHVDAGWIFHGRWWVDRNPQRVATKKKVHHLLFETKNKDSSRSSPCVGDQMLKFRKPGKNAVPILHEAITELGLIDNVNNEEWIRWARPVWFDIDETETLNVELAREAEDERHMHPLALPFIARCVRLWSNPGELVVSPFGGVGSEPYMAVKMNRRAWSCELKRSYWERSVVNLTTLDRDRTQPTLIDVEEEAEYVPHS